MGKQPRQQLFVPSKQRSLYHHGLGVLSLEPLTLKLIATTAPAMGSRLHNAPIVIDNGSGTIRAGFAGEDVPKCFFPSYVGRPKHVRTMAGALEGDVFIGPQAQQYRGLFKINYPLEHGIVTDWDDMERIWQYVYTEGLRTVSEDVSWAVADGVFLLPLRGIRLTIRLHSTPSSLQSLH